VAREAPPLPARNEVSTGKVPSRQDPLPRNEMIINIRVAPKASRNLVKKEEKGFKVYLTKPAVDGEANAQLIELLAEHLKVKKYQLKIVSGEKSRNKLVEIDE